MHHRGALRVPRYTAFGGTRQERVYGERKARSCRKALAPGGQGLLLITASKCSYHPRSPRVPREARCINSRSPRVPREARCIEGPPCTASHYACLDTPPSAALGMNGSMGNARQIGRDHV